MTFWQIFCPVFAALISTFVFAELLNFGVRYYFHRKQKRVRKELETKIANGEIDPMDMLFEGFDPSNFGYPPSTISGNENNSARASHGQYL